MRDKEIFERLRPFLEKRRTLIHTTSVIYWDLATQAARKALAEEGELLSHYDEELALLAKDPDFVALVKEGINAKDADPLHRRLYRSLWNEMGLLEKVPLDIYMDYKRAITKSNAAWRFAREENNFEAWLKEWQPLIEASRVIARARMEGDMKTPYDACLDSYEPGEREETLDAIFTPLKEELIALRKKAATLNPPKPKAYPIEKQRALSYALLQDIGYDLEGGTLSESAHPFSNDNGRFDARLTTHYHVDDWRSNVYTVLHEGGHCIQFQNKPDEEYEAYVESLATAACCETHSRFYENIIGHSPAYLKRLQALASRYLDPSIGEMDEAAFGALMNRVEPGEIRCDADELTYCLHIIIRYEIERDLINGKIEGKDVPSIWNAKYKEYLGVEVTSNARGLMQDTHWGEALWGYFPSYALGNIYGAMIAERMEREIGLVSLIEKGDLETVKKWLRKEDFAYDYLEPGDWIRRAAGHSLDVGPYLRHLKSRYEKI